MRINENREIEDDLFLPFPRKNNPLQGRERRGEIRVGVVWPIVGVVERERVQRVAYSSTREEEKQERKRRERG